MANWTRTAPKERGYYWFLRDRTKYSDGTLSKQAPATVMYKNKDGFWVYVGNDQEQKAKQLSGMWWSEALLPPDAQRWK